MTKSHLFTRYPGGFQLSMKTAKELARQEFGTAVGLMRDPGTNLDGYFPDDQYCPGWEGRECFFWRYANYGY